MCTTSVQHSDKQIKFGFCVDQALRTEYDKPQVQVFCATTDLRLRFTEEDGSWICRGMCKAVRLATTSIWDVYACNA